ncbi:MAG: sodium/solute symporter [Elusimicrobia bacterium]|nr:sodium/solute symporter [Elusimicrobiota bacterium]
MNDALNSWFPGGTTLTAADFVLLGILVAALFGIGFLTGGGEKNTDDFFLARRRIPGWAACLSFVATEISAMTVIGVPAVGFRENWQYAQFFIGSAASRFVIAYLFIPAFYQYNCTTIYEFLRHRFGPQTQYCATLFFFVTRLLASGVRLMAACVAVAVLLGWHFIPTVALFTVISIVYIGYGGIKAVVWTNVLQACIFIVSGVATLCFLGHVIQGGFSSVWAAAGPAGRLSLFNFGPSLGEAGYLAKFFSDPNILWIAVLNGFFTSMAAFGTDHELMQRLLTVETRRESQRTMVGTIGGSFLVLIIHLAIGTGLYVFYAQNPELALPKELDKIYPYFTVQAMPAVLRGLVLCAILMASIDSPLASLTASFVTDIYRPVFKKGASERHYLIVSRICVVCFGLCLAVIAYAFSFYDKMLWLAFKIGGITFGSLLGVFLLGLITKTRSNWANVVSMTAMALINLTLLILSEKKILPLGWSWLVILGTLGTMGLGRVLAPVLDGKKNPS